MTHLKTMCSISRLELETKQPKTTNLGTMCSIYRQELGTDQFRNNVFHLQIRTGSKTVLICQFGNYVFHLEIGTQNKAVLSDQFRNNVFHSQMRTLLTKTFLNSDHRGNNVFHLQMGTRNEMFLFYTRAKVLFLPWKSWSFYSQQEHKNQEQQILEERSFMKYRNSQRNLKSVKKETL